MLKHKGGSKIKIVCVQLSECKKISTAQWQKIYTKEFSVAIFDGMMMGNFFFHFFLSYTYLYFLK